MCLFPTCFDTNGFVLYMLGALCPYPLQASPQPWVAKIAMSIRPNASSSNASGIVIPTSDSIIPMSTLADVSQGLFYASQWETSKMHVQMVATLLATIFLGVSSVTIHL